MGRNVLKLLLEGTGWFTGALLVVMVVTWPVSAQLPTHALEPLHLPDVQGGLYWPWAFSRAVMSGEPVFLRPELHWPDGQDLRPIIWNHAVQLVIWPFFALADPVTATNLSALWIGVLNGIAGAWAGWGATGRRSGALVGLAVSVCAPYGFVEAGVGRPEQGLWAPLALFFGGLVRLWATPASRGAVLACGLGVGLAGAVYWFYAIFLVTLMAVVFPVSAAAGGLDRPRLRGLVLAGVLSVVVALPFALPVLLSSAAAGATIDAALQASEPVTAMQQRASMSLPWGYLGIWASGAERAWRAPLLVLPACLLAALRGRGGVRLVGWMGVVAGVLSAGPQLLGVDGQPVSVWGYSLQLPMYGLSLLPGYERFWWPYRWQAVVLAASTVTLPVLLGRLRRPWVWAVLVLVLSIGEGAWMLRDGGIRPVTGPAAVPEVFVRIGAQDGGPRPILQLPSPWLRNSRVGWIAWHHQPIDGGMGWGLLVAQADQRRAALRSVPLIDAIHRAAAGEAVPHRARWQPDEAGGYHYVILYATEGPTAERDRLRQGTRAVLGAPFYDDGAVVAWVVPGVGTVPP